MAPEPEAKRRASIRTAACQAAYGVLAARRRRPAARADVTEEASPLALQFRGKSPMQSATNSELWGMRRVKRTGNMCTNAIDKYMIIFIIIKRVFVPLCKTTVTL